MKIFAILITVLYLFGCSSKEYQGHKDQIQGSVEVIDYEKSRKTKLSAILKDLKIITLENHSDALIGRGDKVVLDDQNIYILDAHIGKSIYVFDHQGLFKYKINKVGRGPGEYTLLVDFAITENEVIIYTGDAKKMIFYDKANGAFLRERRGFSDYFVNSLHVTNEGNYFIANDHHQNLEKPNSLYILDSTFSIINDLKDSQLPSSPFITSKRVFSNEFDGEIVLYKNTLHETIYQIKGDKITPKFKLHFPSGKQISNSDLNIPDTELFAKVKNNNLIVGTFQLTKTQNALSMLVLQGTSIDGCLFYFEDSKTPIALSDIKNDVVNLSFPPPITAYKDYFVSIMSPEEIQSQVLTQKFNEEFDKLRILNPKSNLFLILYKLDY